MEWYIIQYVELTVTNGIKGKIELRCKLLSFPAKSCLNKSGELLFGRDDTWQMI
jgi:hypothetical protein